VKRTVAIVLFPEVEELDFVGPWEIFTRVKRLEPQLCEAFTVAPEGGEVRCANGLRVIADHSFASAPATDRWSDPAARPIGSPSPPAARRPTAADRLRVGGGSGRHSPAS
jgi:hypothetical protein